MNPPVVSAKGLPSDDESELLAFGKTISEACKNAGMFYLVDHGISDDLLNLVLNQTATFFAQSDEEKQFISIKKSKNYRGYGLLKNYRDWREQIHLGVEAESVTDQLFGDDAAQHAAYWGLWGANQWPQTEGDSFKKTMLAYFAAIDNLSRLTLKALALVLGQPDDFFTSRMMDRPYLLMKAMSYLPQEKQNISGEPLHSGVTAHCDWSWLTFLLQDQVGGLECQDKDGNWRKVDPIQGSLVVNTGELLEIESAGRFLASPHRVINEAIDKQRYSVPLFINPALDSMILPSGTTAAPSTPAHVHKVIKPGSRLSPFVFGESEWQRKASGQWCYKGECLQEID